MKTILFYTPGTCSLAPMVALEWLGQPYFLCRVDKEVRGTALFHAVNPRGQVPALRVDDRLLVETNAILVHLADRRPEAQLLPPPDGGWERDLANQWLAYLGTEFHTAFWPYYNPHRYAKDAALHEAIRASAVEAIARQLKYVNAHLEGRDFIQGPARSVLDVYLHAMDRWANKLVTMARDYPNVWRHQKALAKDEGVRFALSIERGEVPPAAGSLVGHIELSDLATPPPPPPSASGVDPGSSPQGA